MSETPSPTPNPEQEKPQPAKGPVNLKTLSKALLDQLAVLANEIKAMPETSRPARARPSPGRNWLTCWPISGRWPRPSN